MLTATDIAGSYITHFLSLLRKMFLVQLVAQLAAVRKHLSRDMRFLDHGSVQEHSAYSKNKELPLTGALLVLNNNNKKIASPFLVTSAIVTRKKESTFYSTLVLKLLKNTHHYSVCFAKMLAESFPVLSKLCVK